ncbi:MAG: hypothetical protein U5L46_01180 [Agrobacterium sp.]|nr:hypothetical protein [Agrobacterium sp.]
MPSACRSRVLVNAKGCLLGGMNGPAALVGSGDAKALIRKTAMGDT